MPRTERTGSMPPTIGVLGHRWRASVAPWGAVEQWDGLGVLDWYVAADDRWHRPAHEPSVRQTLLDGTPVVETRLRIPNGDAVQRVYAVADHGGLTVVEVENDSPLPIAVAFTGAPVLSARPPADVPIEGIDLPAGTVVFPVGHHATVVVALAHTAARSRAGGLPGGLPTAQQVARGWLAAAERASALHVPDRVLAEAAVRARCQLSLDGPADHVTDPVDFLLGVGELVRMGGVADHWLPEVVDAVQRLARRATDPFVGRAVDAADRLCAVAGESRARRDLATVRAHLAEVARPGIGAPDPQVPDVRFVTALEWLLADGPQLLPGGIPAAWLGQNFEVHGVPTGATSSVSFAVRWHGEHPAVLWECSGEPVTLTAPVSAPGWASTAARGEALWPAPPWAGAVDAAGGDVSFG